MTEQEPFHSILLAGYNQVTRNDPLHQVRSKSWDQYMTIGLPSHKTEKFRYVKTRHLFSPKFVAADPAPIDASELTPLIYPECVNSYLVFLNGHFQPSLSNITALPKQVTVSTLNQAMNTFGSFLSHQWIQSLKLEQDPFAAINAALHRNGAFIYLPPKCLVEVPIQVLFVVDTEDQDPLFLPRLHFFAGKQSQATIALSTHTLRGTRYNINQVTDFSLEEGAHLHVTQVTHKAIDECCHLDALRANLKRESSLKTVLYTQGNLTSRNDYRISLAGENAEAFLHGISLLDGKREAHTQVWMEHQAPHCRSNQLFKGVLAGTSRSSFEGKILVQQAAQKTEAFQLNSHLLLSDLAQAASKPNLEIFADDVKATHGATVGQLNAEHEHYLRTRGLTAAQARGLLVHGFCKEVIDLVTIDSIRQTTLS